MRAARRELRADCTAGERRERVRLRNFLGKVALSTAILALCGAVNLLDAQGVAGKPGEAPTARMDAPNQTQSAAPMTSPTAADGELPGAIYKEAMHPLDVVRQSMENWSDSELAALSIGMHMANEACQKMKPEDYSDDDLFDLAHLCAFGQDWNSANTAAQLYLRGKAPEHRVQAYAISIAALVHIGAPDLALATTRGMMGYPYDADVAYAVDYMKHDLETAGSPDALRLAAEEHEKIIDALRKGVPLKAVYDNTVVNTGALYAMAMEAAFFAHYAGDDAQAAVYAGDVEQALPKDAVLTAEDRQEIDSTNLQYHLLGGKLPRIPVIRSYKSATTKAQIDTNFGAATVLVVFPDWCVQCKKMMPTMTQFGTVNADTPIHAYGLIFKEPGEEAAPNTQKELLGTNVMEVSAETAHSFGTSDYPLGIVVDHAGMIRFIGVLPSDAFNGGGYMEKVITRTVGVQVKAPRNSQSRE
jgi:thiol-disulfide isomerase/thioredoxin